MKKKQLEIFLSKLKEFEKPKIFFEQYTIPSNLAAEILNLAYLSNDIKEKIVCDFGCGSGRLAIGAALLGAKKVFAIDIDKDAIKVAKENLKIAEDFAKEKFSGRVKLLNIDVSNFNKKCDTVLQNPPFGTKKLQSDISFLEKAIHSSKKVYSLHLSSPKNRKFLKKIIEKNKAKILGIKKFKFVLPYVYKFHKKPRYVYFVDLYVIECS